MANILQAFINIKNNYQISVKDIKSGNNRVNNMGEGLENYIKNSFSNTFNVKDKQEALRIYNKTFSYQGNKNNPPDLILKNSDAIEVKKIESQNNTIALNSSYPKSRLYADSPMITNSCRNCEDWDIKDMIYAIGFVKKTVLKSLWLVYGDCFCADKEIYEKTKDNISQEINSISHIEFTPTNELGKVKKIDPLGITGLRIRGMWHIDNPNKIFDYIYKYDENLDFQLICLLTEEKYNSFSSEDKNLISSIQDNNLSIKDIEIKNPNNPVQLIPAKLLVFKV